MMAMGTRCAFPFDASSSRPSARRLFRVFRADCDMAIGTRVPASATRMTARQPLRYNEWRDGDDAMLDINDKVPDLKLEDENGKEVSLKDFRGKTVILFFF